MLNGITIEAINSITSDDWRKVIGHVIKIEDNYWEKDRQIEEIQEQIIINLGEINDSDDFSDSSDDITLDEWVETIKFQLKKTCHTFNNLKMYDSTSDSLVFGIFPRCSMMVPPLILVLECNMVLIFNKKAMHRLIQIMKKVDQAYHIR
nr:unnamed protein product [Callosobruchus chinensis]